MESSAGSMECCDTIQGLRCIILSSINWLLGCDLPSSSTLKMKSVYCLVVGMIVYLFVIRSAVGGVVLDQELCASKTPVDVGMRNEALGSFYFDKKCLFSSAGDDELNSEISLRLNYKKNADGGFVVYNDLASNKLFIYINIRPTLNPNFVAEEAKRLALEEVIETVDWGVFYRAGDYSPHDYNLVDLDDPTHYIWGVSGGACGYVASLNDKLIYEVVMPESEMGNIAEVSRFAKSYLMDRLK